MPTPLYDALVNKVRDWSNKKEAATIPDSVIEDCLRYGADDCYRLLRVPPLEWTAFYTVGVDDNDNPDKVTKIPVPTDLTEFIYLREQPSTQGQHARVFNEITDIRTFLDPYAEKYSRNHWIWHEDYIYIRPQLAVGTRLEIGYYRRLPKLDATFAVLAVNYILGVSDANQPFLTLVNAPDGTPLYFAGSGTEERVFNTFDEAQAYANTVGGIVTTKRYEGKEAPNWLRDSNERMLLWSALHHVGAYLFDEVMEQRYEKKYKENIDSLNREEKFRRARGGNVQINVNTNGLI